ncbi:tetratricopeptide repeat protein [Pleionea litopenaei]|uniref:Tetratricopeptide repeat protein n=1 Tax=Pleionea litopenaei TaxID=3070815 RepID=A0AA51RSM4_9GAMM|nr:tetratricopeptide repeat protein [Pleionea sp. HL-JVS1]WMS86928.1 tetratricopeptide repeat protein [Pleionea sp. HL-JVS1]
MYRSFIFLFVIPFLGCSNSTTPSAESQCEQHYKAESYQVAARVCIEAAELGSINSQWLLAHLHLYKLLPEADPSVAAYWLEQAADNGHTASQRELGKLYLWGRGVKRDPEVSLQWLKLAAREGDIDAEFFIGVLFMGSKDFKADQASAINWFKKAASSGHKMAINNLAWIYSTSTNKSLRNGHLAVDIILPVLKDKPDSPVFLDTLAAAYAEDEQFELAVDTQQKAIEKLSEKTSEEVRAGYLERLSAYQALKPWREAEPAWVED